VAELRRAEFGCRSERLDEMAHHLNLLLNNVPDVGT